MIRKLLGIVAGLAATSAVADSNTFINAAVEGLQLQTAGHASTWRLGEEASWDADLEAGTIVFTFADGLTATAKIQVIGTYNTQDGTFLWGWDHPSVPEPLRRHAQLAREWGEKNKREEFTTRKVTCTEEEAWRFTAVANRLANANGAYRGPSGTALVFMTFGEVKLAKATP